MPTGGAENGMNGADTARASLNSDLAQVAAGDRSALGRVYARTAPKLFGVCLRIVRDRQAAEDVLQEVFLKIWRSAAAFDPARASPITWLCAIARNSAVDWRRRASRALPPPEELPPPGEAPSEVTGADEIEQPLMLRECLDTLDEHQHRFIRAAFFGGFTYAELAERAEVPLGTMKSWVRRGLERLKRCMDGEEAHG
ncbi:sigma-70 family RNA polymerase sigma factor [Sphingomonas sp.]